MNACRVKVGVGEKNSESFMFPASTQASDPEPEDSDNPSDPGGTDDPGGDDEPEPTGLNMGKMHTVSWAAGAGTSCTKQNGTMIFYVPIDQSNSQVPLGMNDFDTQADIVVLPTVRNPKPCTISGGNVATTTFIMAAAAYNDSTTPTDFEDPSKSPDGTTYCGKRNCWEWNDSEEADNRNCYPMKAPEAGGTYTTSLREVRLGSDWMIAASILSLGCGNYKPQCLAVIHMRGDKIE